MFPKTGNVRRTLSSWTRSLSNWDFSAISKIGNSAQYRQNVVTTSVDILDRIPDIALLDSIKLMHSPLP